jgi:hypothetical protein
MSPEQTAAIHQRQAMLTAALKGLGGQWAQRAAGPMPGPMPGAAPGALAAMPAPGPGPAMQMPHPAVTL